MLNPIEWQPLTGCSWASAGCTYCKTMRLMSPDKRARLKRDGLVDENFKWNGQIIFDEAVVHEPSTFEVRTVFYVCPHGDLFHPNVPDKIIDKIFDEIDACGRHWFQILTKRAKRQSEYVSKRYNGSAPPNIAFGVSCERQLEANARIPALIETPAVARYVTLYPLLGPIDLSPFLKSKAIGAVLAGAEVERPADQIWIDALTQACAKENIPFLHSSVLVGEV